jgi:hypothetical protein
MLGNNAVIGTGSGLWIVDVTNPSAPKQVCFWNGIESITDLALRGTTAYVTADSGKVVAVDLFDLKLPKIIGSFAQPYHPWLVRVKGDRVFVGDYTRGVHVIDISDETKPREIVSAFIPGSFEKLVLSGDSMAVLEDKYPQRVLRMFDIRDPDHPKEQGKLALNDTDSGLAVNGKRAYLLGRKSIIVVDIGDSRHPMLMRRTPVSERLRTIEANQQHLFAGSDDGNIFVFDIRDLKDPKAVTTIKANKCVIATALQDSNLIAAHGNLFGKKLMTIFDVSDVNNIKTTANYEIKEPKAIALQDGIGYSADWLFGVTAIDFARTPEAKKIAFYETEPIAASATDVAVKGKTVYVAAEEAGLLILRMK